MVTVTKRIQEVEQPRGGYIGLKLFEQMPLCNTIRLHPSENIHHCMMGHVVDELLRFRFRPSEAFRIAISKAASFGEKKKAYRLLGKIHYNLGEETLRAACQLVSYESVYRVGRGVYKPLKEISPDLGTLKNIRNMVLASEAFLRRQNQPLIRTGATFEGGYTSIITKGECDFITKETLWDLKTSKYPPNSKDILQVLIYYLLAKNSFYTEFYTIRKIGIINPRLNKAYLLSISSVDEKIIEQVKTEVIGYKPKLSYHSYKPKQKHNEVFIFDKLIINKIVARFKKNIFIVVILFIVIFLYLLGSAPIKEQHYNYRYIPPISPSLQKLEHSNKIYNSWA